MFTTGLTAATTLLFGIAPAVRATQVAPIDVVKEHGRGTSREQAISLSGGLIIVQMALSVMLVVAASLFVRTYARLVMQPLGFDSHQVLVVNVNATRAHIEPSERLWFYQRLVDAVASVPGVSHAGGSAIPPVSGGGLSSGIEIPGVTATGQDEPMALVNFVTPGWFAACGIPLQRGRDVAPSDTQTSAAITLVNEAFVRKFFPDREPIGRTVSFVAGRAGEVQRPKTIIGVAANAVYRSLRDDVQPTMYVPLAQWNFPMPLTGVSIGVRPAFGSPAGLARGITTALIHIDPDLAFNFRPLQEAVASSLIQERLTALLSVLFGSLGLLLAGLGLYGVTAYAVAQRRVEIGIRLALGGTHCHILGMMLSAVSVRLTVGVLAGIAGSLLLSRFLRTLLFGVAPGDPGTLLAAVGILLAVGILAGWLPARRASRLDPAEVLRES
jgi:predicted permease